MKYGGVGGMACCVLRGVRLAHPTQHADYLLLLFSQNFVQRGLGGLGLGHHCGRGRHWEPGGKVSSARRRGPSSRLSLGRA